MDLVFILRCQFKGISHGIEVTMVPGFCKLGEIALREWVVFYVSFWYLSLIRFLS